MSRELPTWQQLQEPDTNKHVYKAYEAHRLEDQHMLFNVTSDNKADTVVSD